MATKSKEQLHTDKTKNRKKNVVKHCQFASFESWTLGLTKDKYWMGMNEIKRERKKNVVIKSTLIVALDQSDKVTEK